MPSGKLSKVGPIHLVQLLKGAPEKAIVLASGSAPQRHWVGFTKVNAWIHSNNPRKRDGKARIRSHIFIYFQHLKIWQIRFPVYNWWAFNATLTKMTGQPALARASVLLQADIQEPWSSWSVLARNPGKRSDSVSHLLWAEADGKFTFRHATT